MPEFEGDSGSVADSAPAPAPDVAPAPAPAPSAEPSRSPAAPEGAGTQAVSGDTPKPTPSFHEVIERALGDDKRPASPAASESSESGLPRETHSGRPATPAGTQAGAETDAELLGEPPEEEIQQWQSRTRKRFHALSNKVKELAPRADAYQKIDSYLKEAKLEAEEVMELFELGRMLKAGDYEGFFKLANPHLERIGQVRGVSFPADIQQRMDNGYIDEASARELTRARIAQEQANHVTDRQNQEHQTRQRTQLARDVASAVTAWEQEISRRDPAYPAKVELMNDRIRVLMAAEGVPMTREGAVEMSRKAYAHVTAQLAQVRAPGRPTSMNPTATGSNVNGVMPRPRNAREAMLAALG